MNKYALGTIFGTALLGLTKAKGSNAKKLKHILDFAVHGLEIIVVVGYETGFYGHNAANPFNVPQEVINAWEQVSYLPLNGIQYRNLIIDMKPADGDVNSIASLGYYDESELLTIRKTDGSPFTYKEIDETWMIVKTVIQDTIYKRAVEALKNANIRWNVPYALFMVMSGWEFNNNSGLTSLGVNKEEYENYLQNPLEPLDKMEPEDAPTQYMFYISIEKPESTLPKLRKR
jgi:hypothetical protein